MALPSVKQAPIFLALARMVRGLSFIPLAAKALAHCSGLCPSIAFGMFTGFPPLQFLRFRGVWF